MKLTWTAPSNGGSDITGYNVYLYNSSGSVVASSTSVSASATSYTFSATLSPGATYYATVAAKNSVGTADYAKTSSVTAWTKPSAVGAPTVTAGNGSLTVKWNAPSSTRTISNYRISYTTGSTTNTVEVGSNATSKTITGLTNGATYSVKVQAYSEVGWGDYGSATNGTPYTVPGAPTISKVEPGNGTLKVTWSAPSSNGGNAISSYTIKYGSTTKTGISSTVTSYTIPSLTNGTAYSVQVGAVNSAGTTYSTAVSGTPRTVPSGVTISSATAGNKSIALSWSVPTNNGSAVTNYQVSYTPSGGSEVTTQTTSTSITLSNLTANKAYTVKVKAYNAAGWGDYGTAKTVTPYTNPGTPTNVTATVTSGTTATVTWTKPSENGATISKYVISGGEKDVEVTGESTTSVNITGLTMGKAYTFTVKAVNSVGTSEGGTSNAITMWKNPGDVTELSATVKSASQIDLSWKAPTDTGNTTLSGYDVTVSPSGGTVAISGTTATVTGLSEGVMYTFTVKAKNSVDSSTGVSTTATTWARPSAPSSVTATVLSGTSVKLTWSAAAANGQDVTNYVISGHGDAKVTFGEDGLSATITGLVRNKSYTLGVAGVNSVGTGTAATTTVKTLTKPTAPSIAVTPQDKAVKVDITAPSDDGGADIKEYTVHYQNADGKEHKAEYTSAKSITISGLANGTEYEFWVVATNSENLSSAESAKLKATPRTTPDKVATLTAEVKSKTSVELVWEAPYDGGNAISEYVIEYKAGNGEWSVCKTVTVDAKAAALMSLTDGAVSTTFAVDANKITETITGLKENTQYKFRIKAKNEAGYSGYTESDTVTTWIEPSAPTGVTVVSGEESGTLVLSWTAPFDGNTEILGYTLYIDGVAQSPVIDAKATTYTITGLTDGQVYTVALSATNAAGEGSKCADLTGRPRRAADAPTITEIKAGNKQAFISINAPSDNGGATISEYRVYVDGDYNRTVNVKEVTDIAINGLTNNVTYSITVTAVNAAGESKPSEAKSVKVGMPRPPENIEAVPGNCETTISYTAAESNGNVVTGYKIYIDGKEKATVDGDVLKTTVGNLINGMTYKVQVSTLSAAGESLLSDEVTVYVGAPTAPIITDISVGEDSVTLTWTDSETHGLLMKSYNVYLNGEKKLTTLASVKTATIDGLTKGETYAIQVAGANIAGEGEKSEPYKFVVGSPDAPENVTVTGGDSTLNVEWTAADGNGSEVIKYVVYLNGEQVREVTDGTSVTLDSLANGVTYEVAVSAVNEYGEGFKSEKVTGMPFTYSHAPTNVIAEVTGSTTATLSWVAPLNDGGEAVTGYEIGGADGAEVVINGTSATITGLTPATEYTFSVAAKNKAGSSPSAEANTIVTWTTAAAPIMTSVESGNGSATLTWDAPLNDGGTGVTSYNVYVNGVKHNKTPITAKTYTVANLENGSFYSFTVAAVNAVGEGQKAESQTLCIGIPTTPQITGVTAGDGTAKITWNPSVENAYNISGYKLYLDGQPKAVVVSDTEYTFENLTNGQTYTIALTALCGMGETAMSNSVTVTPGTLTAPANVKVTAGTAQVSVNWDAVADAAGYVIYLDGKEYKTVTVPSCVIDGLSNREYEIAVATKNAYGIGNLSEAIAVTPWTVPDSPEITSVASTVDGFEVEYTEPKANGKAIKHYVIYANGEEVAQSTTLSATVSGLTSGETYEVTVKAVSDAGASAASTAATLKVGTPGKTEITSVEIGDGELTVHFNEAAQNGGSITHYNVYADIAKQDGVDTYSNEKISVTTTETSAKIEGLTNGVNYAITVEAVNSVGVGPLSDVYYAVPGAASAPIMSSAIAGDGKVTIAWKKPLDGGETVQKYRIYVDGGFRAETTSLTYEIGGLDNGTEYSFGVSAVNANGESAVSELMTAMPCTTPQAPQNITAVATSENTVKLTWGEPANNGGMAVTSYIVDGDGEITMGDDGLSAEITGLKTGKTYTFTVTAVNECGKGEVGTSNEVTTLTVPDKPSILLLEAGDGEITIAEWEEPEYDGGSEILGYNVYYKEGKLGELVQVNTELVTDVPYTIKGLTNGVTYYVYIDAVNSIGRSDKSSASGSRPAGSTVKMKPYAPQNLAAESGDKEISISWSEPVFDGNAEIEGYNVYVDNKKYTTVAADDMACDITSLNNGTEYAISVTAVNAVGEGDSAETTAMPEAAAVVTAPGAIDNDSFSFTVDAARENAILVWNAPENDGGSPITGYKITVNGIEYTTTTTTDTTFTLPVGFGQQYAVQVAAVNEVGTGAATKKLAVAYNINIDTNGDGEVDINLDTNGDGKADVNIDLDGDNEPDLNIKNDNFVGGFENWDIDNDGEPDLNIKTDDGYINIDTTGDKKADTNIDTDGDGLPDLNIDTNGDNKPDINIDTDGDGKADINIDWDDDGKPDINIDTDGDGKADMNIDTDGDGKADINIDTDDDGKADLNVDTNGDGKPDINIDTDNDGVADTNIDENGDGKIDEPGYTIDPDDVDKDIDGDGNPDINIKTDDGYINVDTDGDNEPDINIDLDGDGKPDINIDTNGDGIPDLNIDIDGDNKPDINIDTNGDGKADINIDINGDNIPDINIDTDGDGEPDEKIDSNGNFIPDEEWSNKNDPETPSEERPTAPVITGTVSDGLQTITVEWTADSAEDENVTGYNVYVNGKLAQSNWATTSYQLTAQSATTYEIYVTAVNADGESDPSNVWTTNVNLNIDTDNDGEADKNLDEDGDGTADDVADTVIKITGSVVFTGTSFSADVKLLDSNGFEVAATKAANGETFEISKTITAGNVDNEVYSLVVSGKNSTVTTVTDITLGDEDIELGKLTIYVGDVDGDGVVNMNDFALVKGNYGGGSDWDIDGDGEVNMNDAASVKGSYGRENSIISFNKAKAIFGINF